MGQSGNGEQERVSKLGARGSRLHESVRLSLGSQTNEHHRGDKTRERKWLVLVVLLLGILISHAPLVYGHAALVEGGVSKNNVMVSVVLPFLSQILMIAAIIGMRSFTNSFPPITMSWIGKKRSTILGAVALPIILVTANSILLYIFKRLRIPLKDPMIVSITTLGIALMVVQTLRIVLVTPIVEEIFWRGYAQDILQRTFNRPIGLFAQAVLFAFVHMMGLAGSLQIFIIGFVLGLWRCRKRTLVPLIVAHMVVNSLYCVRFWYYHMELQMVRTTHDYRASLEELCKPSDYAPNENALPQYARAFELLVDRPKELDKSDLKVWPVYLAAEKMKLLSNWISSNRHAIAEFEVGTQKPYYCRQYSKEPFEDVMFPPISKANQIVSVVLLRAQMSAIEGNLKQSVSDILTCYRFGQHLSGPKPMVELLMGLVVKERAIQVAFRILGRAWADFTYLNDLQSGFETLSDKSIAPVDFSGERLICHGIIQKLFTDDGIGQGHIPQLFLKQLRDPPQYLRQALPGLGEDQMLAWEKLERRQTTRLMDKTFAYLDSIKACTPAELHRTGREAQNTIRQIAKDNVLLQILIPEYENVHNWSYRCEALRDALIVTSAILRYRLGQDNPPQELGQLIRSKYLVSLPLDPYSDAPFIYRKLGSNFLLYSLGPDFDDDGGVRRSRNSDMVGGDEVFWPFRDN